MSYFLGTAGPGDKTISAEDVRDLQLSRTSLTYKTAKVCVQMCVYWDKSMTIVYMEREREKALYMHAL